MIKETILISILQSFHTWIVIFGVYISQLIRISRICDNFMDFNVRHLELTTRLQKQGYKYDKLCYNFKKFWRKHTDLMSKFRISVHDCIKDGISLPLNSLNQLNCHVTKR